MILVYVARLLCCLLLSITMCRYPYQGDSINIILNIVSLIYLYPSHTTLEIWKNKTIVHAEKD